MTYQVLARKWRPQDFSSIVGQEPIVTALRNALTDGRIAQAYLFSGIRGVGKTTAARVLAKALNCENGPAADPCNECAVCRDITGGHDMDVIEVDAATYSKVEQVRELTESLRYGPARDRYKVVVLDEVHRLSRQAFDALLKIVEEPPEHLVFVFATTEIDAVPATILSRCQEFQFRRVSSAALTEHLRRISEAEGIETSEAALRWIARAGEGSVRDSVALLDQLATFGGGTVEEADARRLLGGLDTEIFSQLLTAILAGDAGIIREIARQIEHNGWDPNHVYGQFLLYARDALHLALGGELESVDLPADEARQLGQQVEHQSYENLLRLVQLLLASEPTVRRSEFGHLALEITWLRAAQLPKLTRVEELLAGSGATAGRPGQTASVTARAKPPQPKTVRSRPLGNPAAGAPGSSEAGPGAATSSVTGTIEAFLERLKEKRPLVPLFPAERLAFDDGELKIYPPPGDRLIENKLNRRTNREFFDSALKATFGPGARWRLVAAKGSDAVDPASEEAPAGKGQGSPARSSDRSPQKADTRRPAQAEGRPAPVKSAPVSAPKTPPAEPDDLARAKDSPLVQAVLDIFNGSIQATQPGTKESDKE